MIACIFRRIRHASLMMVRTLRNYAMLSLSVVLSFSVLLTYLVWTDSSLFNEYKAVLYKPEGWAMVRDHNESSADLQALAKLTESAGGSRYVVSRYSSSLTVNSETKVAYRYSVYTIPTRVPELLNPLFAPLEQVDIRWLDGRDASNIMLNTGEVIISENAYRFFFTGDEKKAIIPVGVSCESENRMEKVQRWMDCKVVGVISAPEALNPTIDQSDNETLAKYWVYITAVMSQATMNQLTQGATPALSQRCMLFNAERPEIVVAAAEQLGMPCVNVYEAKTQAMEELQLHAQTKLIIVLLLFVILGINLYGGFSNVLERRRFEVGIKRALGASKWDIIGQFMWESLLLMLCNILITIVLVFNGFLIYKYIFEYRFGFEQYYRHIWTIYVNETSVGMFIIVTLALTLLFSGIFAVKATQVKVVDYLKAE